MKPVFSLPIRGKEDEMKVTWLIIFLSQDFYYGAVHNYFTTHEKGPGPADDFICAYCAGGEL